MLAVVIDDTGCISLLGLVCRQIGLVWLIRYLTLMLRLLWT